MKTSRRLIVLCLVMGLVSPATAVDLRDLYFGEALFRDALAKTTSFPEAFEVARQIVTQREAAEHLPASQPQIAVGRSIGALLGGR
jgi:hypothetical protein